MSCDRKYQRCSGKEQVYEKKEKPYKFDNKITTRNRGMGVSHLLLDPSLQLTKRSSFILHILQTSLHIIQLIQLHSIWAKTNQNWQKHFKNPGREDGRTDLERFLGVVGIISMAIHISLHIGDIGDLSAVNLVLAVFHQPPQPLLTLNLLFPSKK